MTQGVAYIFPGQGSQYVGMGKDAFEQSQIAMALYQRADAVLGFPLTEISFSGPEEKLRQTEITQPAIFMHSMALGAHVPVSDAIVTAGHSLGEYSALVFAGAITFEDGLKLVRLRGQLMQRAGVEQPGTMAAIIGLDGPTLEAVCEEAESAGIVRCANFNSPGQIVISGAVAGVKNAMVIAKTRGARMVKELVVSGAFHSPLMQTARDAFQAQLEQVHIEKARIPVYSNVSACPVTEPSEIRRMLAEQLTAPVRWEESMRAMISAGIRTFVEIGPGTVLQGLAKRIDSSVAAVGVDKFDDVGSYLTLSQAMRYEVN